jgi:filamentous hemagglutinin family protein
MIRTTIAALLGTIMIPSLLLAGPTVPGVYGNASRALPQVIATQLPVLKPGGILYGASTPVSTASQMTIYQIQPQAIIDWSSFNIGTNASVYFNQKGNTSWVALNRIWDANPTQIFGHLTADGKIYLINQNGILFGPGSQVNVSGLVASSLNLSIDNFLAGTLTFNTQQGTMSQLPASALLGTTYVTGQDSFYGQSNLPGTTSNPGAISNAGTIQTGSNGSVFLIGPRVENGGTIVTPSGQIGLAAGMSVALANPPVDASGNPLPYPSGTVTIPGLIAEGRTALAVAVNSSTGGNTASNLVGGLLAADTGLVGMYGNIVNQDGLIRSVTGVQRGGHVELFASGTITTGPGSLIYLPVSTSPSQFDPSLETAQSTVVLSGLDPNNPAQPTVPASLIVHQGAIVAPSGYVSMNAASRVYLAPGSLIDVSGLWVYESADAMVFQVQMNSLNLRDYYLQQGGILQGQTITLSGLAGSALGDVSGAFLTQNTTAAQRHTAGGEVDITSTGDIVVRQGAVIDFSGGGIVYAPGAVDTTMLVSSYSIYDISSAGADIDYSSILNFQTFTNSRFGITQEYEGVYYGGASPLRQYSQGYTVGSNAGTLSLQAPTVVLDGTILGFATNGIQQVLAADPTNIAGNQSAYGYAEAEGGTLKIGKTDVATGEDTTNFVVQAIVVSPQGSPLPSTFQPTDPLPSTTTTLAESTLNNAGLSNLSLAANTTITVQKGAQVTLNPGGTFLARAREIENFGGITAPGGTINLSIETDLTTNPNPNTSGIPTSQNYVPLNEMIYLADGSSLIVSGERIDNTAASALSVGLATSGYINGGSINILDRTVTGQGVIVGPGALIDVSGGYQVSTSGKITGGDAGSLSLQGYAVVLAGDLRAYSLLGNSGGALTVLAGNVTIAPSAPSFPYGLTADAPLSGNLQGQFILGANQLDGTGFTNITLKSVNDVVMEGGTLGPSLVKLATPLPAGGAQGTVPGVSSPAAPISSTYTATPYEIGTSAVTLIAGTGASNLTDYGPLNPAIPNSLAKVAISPGAAVVVGPGGAITMNGPYIEVGGLLDAPSGTITVTGATLLSLATGASILANGYNEPGTTAPAKWLPVDATPLPGGTVTLTTTGGDLDLAPGSLVSVSGSSPTPETVIGTNGWLSFVANASQPGAISLSAYGTINLGGNLKAQAAMAGLPGGTLSITETNEAATLSLSAATLASFRDAGFDAVTLASAGLLSLSGSGQISFGRRLTLDAPEITGSGTDQITLAAPWVQVQALAAQSTAGFTPPSLTSPASGDAQITLQGTWLDVTGAVLFSGFRSVNLEAARDMTFTDAQYGGSYYGQLGTAGYLTLQAARIYPTTLSSFTIDAGGKVTILPSGTAVAGPVYSAGGNLTIISGGAGIDQEGYLAAPMGGISLQAPNGRVYLGSGSVTTTNGGSTAVLYGAVEPSLGENVWGIVDKAAPGNYTAVQGAPSGSISLSGSEVIVREGALLDASGGGSVFTYQFVPSTTGLSSDPLAAAKTYVIVPDGSVVLPGNAVYLSGIKGLLPAGTYSLLPVDPATGLSQYAFLPGAMVVTDLGTTVSTNKATVTADGYPVVGGYYTFMGTSIASPQLEAFEVRPASAVVAQAGADYQIQTLVAGAAGSVTVTGSTTILNGTIRANSLPGYPGGTIALSGSSVTVQQAGASLPPGFTFSTPVPSDLAGTLNIAASSLSGEGFQTIGLGVSDLSGSASSIAASTVEIKPGVTLQAENIILGAASAITLDAGSQVLALALPGDTGQATFISPTGTLNIGANAVVHASNSINLQAANTVIDPTATLKADHSSLDLQGSAITVYNPVAASQTSGSGLFLTLNQWDNFASLFSNITLTSLSDLVFEGSFAPGALGAVAGTLFIDAGRIMDSVAKSSVFLSAQTIGLQNTTGASPGGSPAAAASQITLSASQIQVNQGSILFGGFANVNLNGQGNVTFRGVGSLSTGGGNLTISSPRVATSYYLNPVAGIDPATGEVPPPVYTAANYSINARNGTVTMEGSGPASASLAAPGGTLAVTAGQIDVSTIVEVPSGQIELTATGNINLGSGGQLLARGYYSPSTGTTVQTNAPGGVVSLTSTGGGAITVNPGALIDVSAGAQGDAGSIGFYAPVNGVALNGSILGQAAGGKGGSLSLVTNSINDFGALNNSLSTGGFTNSLNIEASTGNIAIAAGDYVRAGSLTVTADKGSVDLYGTIDVSGSTGGTAELYALDNLMVTGTILARGTAGPGGDVTLGTSAGTLTLAGGTIDVSGTGSGGSVTFQAPLTAADNYHQLSLSGAISGASGVYVDALETFAYNVSSLSITSSLITSIQSQTSTFMTNMDNYRSDKESLQSLLSGGVGLPSSQFHLRPSVVIENTGGSMTLGSNWNLTTLRYGTEPGVLTLRAAGNLSIDGSIIDDPSSLATLTSANAKPSWGINLVAGAQTASPDLVAVMPAGAAGQGELTILTNEVVYTETGSLRFASAGNTVINQGPQNPYMISSTMHYSLGTYAGSIQGDVGGSLSINPGGAIQSATGSIGIIVGGDLDLILGNASFGQSLGSIRTTGEQRTSGLAEYDYYGYGGGGSITLEVGGSVNGGLNPNAWLAVDTDQSVPVTPIYGRTSTEGIVAMAGGSVYVWAGGNFDCQTGTFGQGNLQVYAGGNMTGRFLVEEGIGTLSAMGNFGMPTQLFQGAIQNQPQLIEMSAAQVSVSAQGNIELGAALNPNLANAVESNTWDNGYTPNSSLALTAVTGDVNIYGTIDSTRYGTFYDASVNPRITYLPPSVTISAGTDINVMDQSTQLPSPNGTLSMNAGRDIVFSGGATWLMSDADPALVYIPVTYNYNVDLTQHAAVPVHTGDTVPVTITAGGDITDMNLTVPKMAVITAGGDIEDLNFTGQNVGAGDVTRITAGGDIVFGYGSNAAGEAIQVGGPGYVVVQAGRTIDLGDSNGILTYGNSANHGLSGQGASLIVAAGVSGELNPGDVPTFFDSLRSAGTDYSNLQAAGNAAGAQAVVSQARATIITPFLGPTNGAQDITMTSSQISTTGGGSLFIVATGSVNVGTTELPAAQNTFSNKQTGILTETGGGINIFSGGDVNVNEARVMTFQGGDITVWSDRGNVNAGRGDKEAVSVREPTYSCVSGVCTVKFAPPAVGSGIRALTYAPAENVPAPPEGNIYLFAPSGIIDAGEAGISGASVTLGATAILNVANISFSTGSVGLPAASQTVSLGALTGTTNLGEKGTVSQNTGVLAGAQGGVGSTQPIEEMLKWVNVQVVSYDLGFQGEPEGP